MTALRVLHFTNSAVRAGAEEHMLMLLQGLDRARFRSFLACPPDVIEKLRPDIPPDVAVLPIHLQTPWSFREVWRLATTLLRERIDVLHSHMFFSSVFASPIGRACGVPGIVETPHVREHWRRSRIKSSMVVDRLVGRAVDRFIAVSEANARFLIRGKGLPAHKVTVIRNGVALQRFESSALARANLRQQLDVGEDSPVVMVVARLEPQKGHRVLIEAMPAVFQEVPKVRLICLGEGGLRDELEALAHARGVGRVVRFVGGQTNVADWLSMADITVLPSFYEGLPLAAIESLAASRPVVATDVDGTPEVVVHEKTGLLVRPGDATGLGRAVCRLLRDPRWARALGKAGREWVWQRFSCERQVEETQRLYLELATPRRSRIA